MIDNLLNAFQPYLPEIYFFALAIGTLSLICLVFYIGSSIARNLRKKTWTRPPESSNPQNVTLWRKGLNFFQKMSSKTTEVKQALGWVEKNEISHSFLKTIEILKTYMSSHQPQYELPWYMVLGAESSGKTTLLNDINLELPIGRPDYDTIPELSPLEWHFFDQALVIDLKGSAFLGKNQTYSDQKSFETILKLLTHFRVKRPLDGLILTLPADELWESQCTESETAERAKYIYTQLWKLQTRLGMKIPVYILVTKCDILPGFQSLVKELNSTQHQDIFGWSCPYSLETGYNSLWIHEIFNHMRESLHKLRAAIFTQGNTHNVPDQEGNLLFPLEFMQLKSKLSIYLDTIFKKSSYYESFFLRGLYFCGRDASQENQRPLYSDTSLSLSLPAAFIHGKQGKIVFLKDLFAKKIFKEATLGQPIRKILVSSNRFLNISKLISLGVALLWIGGLWFAYHRLERDITTVIQSLYQIKTSLEGFNKFSQGDDDPKRQNYLIDQSDKILKSFTGIQMINMGSLFLPLSWFSDVEDNILESFARGYDQIIFPSLYQGLVRKAGEIVTINNRSHTSIEKTEGILNPLFLDSFNQVNNYMAQISLLEEHIDNYNNLPVTENITDLGKIIVYLYGKVLSRQFYQNIHYYKDALSKSVTRIIDLSNYKSAAAEKLGTLYRFFIEDTFNLNNSYGLFETLVKKMAPLSDGVVVQNMQDIHMRQIGEQAIVVADALSSGQLSWIERNYFDPGPHFATFMNNVIQSSLLGNDAAVELSKLADREFIKFKLALQTYQSVFTGPFFKIREGQIIAAPSKGLIQFIDALTSFLNEPFMKKSDAYKLHTKVPSRKLLFWDEVTLNKAVKTLEVFNDFLLRRLKTQPPHLQSIMRTVGQNSVRIKTLHSIAKSQIFQDEPPEDSFGQREILHSQVQNIAAVTPFFAKLFGAFQEGGAIVQNAHLRELLIRENYGILTKIENMMAHDNLYALNEDSFDEWDGKPMLGMKAFSVHDINDMKAYLKAQRFRLNFFARELAEPIITLLSLGYLEDIPLDLPLASRWARIISVLDDYEKQSPGNSLKILEQFLLYDFNEITLENCSRLKNKGEGSPENDYFMEVRRRIAAHLLRRGQSLEQNQFYKCYTEAATFFNLNLSGRFPFTSPEDQQRLPEAHPQDVATFFQLYKKIPETDLKSAFNFSNASPSQTKVRHFIKKIQNVRPLILAALDAGMEGAVPHIDFEVEFRADRSHETGGDRIIDWSLKTGPQDIHFWNQNRKGTWQVGQPIQIRFKWAQDADNSPLADPGKPELTISDSTAAFSYAGRWSLIQLLRSHAFFESRSPSEVNQQFYILEFQIPTMLHLKGYKEEKAPSSERRSQDAKVYLKLSLQDPSRNTAGAQEKGNSSQKTLFAVPHFPTEAPLLERASFFFSEEELPQ